MSIYDHINDPIENKATCSNCGKEFKWSEYGPFYPGGKSTEFIKCPYCDENNGSVRTSGYVFTNKLIIKR